MTDTTPTKEAFAYFATWNNPHDHCATLPALDYSSATPEQFIELQMAIIQMFVHASPRARKPETSSIMVGCELSPSGTFHCHMLFAAKRKLSFDTLCAIYPGIHLEMTRGTYEDNHNYLHKQGSEANEAKADTKLCEPLSWGDYCFTPKDQQPGGSVFARINDMLDEGMTPQEIYVTDVKLAYYANAIERTYAARQKGKIPTMRDITTYYHVGESGTGKSYSYVTLADQHGADSIHRIAGDYQWVFDGYEFQSILFLDEFRDSCIPFSTLLSYLDVYPLKLNIKNGRSYATYTEVHITSVIPPEHLYQGVDFLSHDTRAQLYRRINYIVYHWKDEQGSYHQYQMPFSDYEDYAQLIAVATGNPPEPPCNPPVKPEKAEPEETPSGIEPAACKAIELRDVMQYRVWFEDYYFAMAAEPPREEFKHNPFIQYSYSSDGHYVSTEFDTLAFLESMNWRKDKGEPKPAHAQKNRWV